MDRSRTPGMTSFAHRNNDEQLAHLQTAARSPVLVALHQVLGPEALLHLVGGTVRDHLCGKQSADFDLASVFPPEKSRTLLEAKGFRVVDTGIKHGTITVVIDGSNIEITTFRLPGPSDSAAYSTFILEDLSGRDFTINAMALSLDSRELIDPFSGRGDLNSGLLRAVGSPKERFSEDPLRIMRLFRFGPAQGFEVDPQTLDAAIACLPAMKRVSTERIKTEIEKILVSAHPAQALRLMAKTGVIEQILPELTPSFGFEQNRFHTQDVFEHTLTVLENCPPDLGLRLAALFHDTGKPATLSTDELGQRHFYEHEVLSESLAKKAMRRLRFSNDRITEVSTLVRLHMRPVECGPAGVRRLMRDLGPYFAKWRNFKEADATPTMPRKDVLERLASFDTLVAEEQTRLANAAAKRLTVNGYDLIEMGYVEGRALGSVLKAMEEMVIDDPSKNERSLLLDYARQKLAALS